MDISEQSVKAHYGELIGVGKEWEVERVEVHHLERRLEAWVRWRKGVPMLCPQCGQKCPGYDHSNERTWRHLDACGYTTVLHARIPRGQCQTHKVISMVPSWAEPGSRFTLAFERYAIDVLLAARSVSAACGILGLDWDSAHLIQKRGVARGLAQRKSEKTEYLGIDEKSFGKGQSYGTVLSDLTGGRVLEVMENRDQATATQVLRSLPEEQRQSILGVAMDMWKPFTNAVQNVLPWASIVHDRFHIVKYLTEGVDKVRRAEHKALSAQGDDRLKGTKFDWLTHPDNLSDERWLSLEQLLAINLKTGRAWAFKETMAQLWDFGDREAAEKFFKEWFGKVKRSKLEPMKKVADMIKRHIDNILTYYEHRITNAAAEGLNSIIQVIKSNARGFRNFANYRIAILFHLGKLDLKPAFTHSLP
jgi:transposase